MSHVLSGFPEWLPEQELVQQHVLAVVRRSFELHGYTPLHLRSVERVEDLLHQGETDKEIYGLHRLAKDAADGDSEAKLGLHYDLTVPFARYVCEHRTELSFPFRRYQVQPVWRGERPQLGRYREFLQADADVIGSGELDLRFDTEMVRLLGDTLDKLPIPPVKLQVNNRKLLEGFYRGLGVTDIQGTLRLVDKLPKIGAAKVRALLVSAGLDEHQARACVALTEIELHAPADADRVRALGVHHPWLEEGLRELVTVVSDAADPARRGSVVGALHIARGLDYYTGTVVEGTVNGHEKLGAVCSGGRYDNLASDGKGKLPGVGISIGITRLLGYFFHHGHMKQARRTTAEVVVAVHSLEQRDLSERVARTLRTRGIATLVSDSSAAYGKQIKAASQLGVPYVWFPAVGDKPHEVKDLRSGNQRTAMPETWEPEAIGLGEPSP